MLGTSVFEAGQQQQFYHPDGLGTVRLLTNADGTVNTRTDYDAFGRLLGSSSGDNPYQFAGERRDAETGLDYLRARYYDSELGRFISRDAFGGWLDSPISQNKYLYADGNPVNFTDPTGYFTWAELDQSIVVSGILAAMALTVAWGGWSAYNALNNPHNLDDYSDGFKDAGSTAGAATGSNSGVLYNQGFVDGLSAQGTYGEYGSRLRFGIGDQSWTVSTGNSGGTSFTTNSDITWAIQTDDLLRSFKGEGASYSTDTLRGMGNMTVISEPAEPQIYTSPGGNPSGFAPPESFPGGSNGDLFGGTGGFELGSAPSLNNNTGHGGIGDTSWLSPPFMESTKQGGKYTEPTLPNKVIAEAGQIKIVHNYRSNDHGPAHVHITGGGAETRVKLNGDTMPGDPAPTAKQQKVIDENISKINRDLNKIVKWLKYQDLPDE